MSAVRPDDGTPTPVALHEAAPLAVVRLQDPAGTNHLSRDLCVGITAALRQAGANPDVRAIVLASRSRYFCAGAPAERMLGSHDDRVVDVWTLMRSVLDCPVPVVAAAQGHALGGGLLLALYCDVAVLSENSRYAANFLMHGFTPIGGATFLLPHVMGQALGREMLYTGRTYRGSHLAQRGVGVLVAGHDEVETVARRVAMHIAQAPRRCVELVKAQLVAPVLAGAQAALASEIPSHEETVGSEEARRRIRMLGRTGPSPASPPRELRR